MKYSILAFLLITSCGSSSLGDRSLTSYKEVPYTLKDGTPCTIIRGGTHSGMVGITCDYGTENNNEE